MLKYTIQRVITFIPMLIAISLLSFIISINAPGDPVERLAKSSESDALIEEANKTLDYEAHRNALLKLQARIYEDQPYVFLYVTKRKFAIHKRFDNREMFFEFPSVMLNNLKLNSSFVSSDLTQ